MPTILITGANRGIGLEFVKQYSNAGWRVHACYRTLENSKMLKQLASTPHSNIAMHQLDLTDFGRIDALAEMLSGETIDVLINNAGVFPDKGSKGFMDTDYEAWRHAHLVNTMAPLKMTEAFFRHIANGAEKKVVFITSKVASITGNSVGGHYLHRSSKVGLNMIAKNLSIDLAPQGVSIAILDPGWVRSDMGGEAAPVTPERSVAGMRKIISKLNVAGTGKFVSYNGQEVSW